MSETISMDILTHLAAARSKCQIFLSGNYFLNVHQFLCFFYLYNKFLNKLFEIICKKNIMGHDIYCGFSV